MSDYTPEFTEEQFEQFFYGRPPILSPSPQIPFSGFSPEIHKTTHFAADSMVIHDGLNSYDEFRISNELRELYFNDVTFENYMNLPGVENYTKETSKTLVPTQVDEISNPRAGLRKNRHSGLRKDRHTFTLHEVKTLIEAVEMLGKGRWHLIKEIFFRNANHRDRGDLKDKWRTLIKTARMAPNKRRSDLPECLLQKALDVDARDPRKNSIPSNRKGN